MRKWHWYIKDDGSGYWSENPPHTTKEAYIAWIMADEKPSGPPWSQANKPRAQS